MAKYGSFRYSNAKYGTGAVVVPTVVETAPVTWIVLIDWGSGFGFNEAKYLLDYTLDMGRDSLIAAGATSFTQMQPGQVTLTMDNSSGRYDPWVHTSIQTGVRIKVEVKENVSGTRHTRFVGTISNIVPNAAPPYKVTITAVDDWKLVQSNKQLGSFVPLYQTTISDAMRSFLAYMGLDSSGIQDWAQPIGIFDPTGPLDQVINPWGPQQTDPTVNKQANGQSVLLDLVTASLGDVFVANDGNFRFYPINYSGMPSHTLDQSHTLKEIVPTAPWETKRDRITLQATRRGKTPLERIWYEAGPRLLPGQTSVMFDISYPAATGIFWPAFFACETPNPTNTTSNLAGLINGILLNITSTKATVSMYNTDPRDLYIFGLAIDGCVFKQTAYTVTAGNGNLDYSSSSPWMQDQGYANAYAPLLLSYLSDPQKNPTVQIQGRPTEQFDYNLLDHVHYTSSKLNIDDTYSVGHLHEEWKADNQGHKNGQSVLTVLKLQKLLYSADAITADPYYPGYDPIPPDNGGGTNGAGVSMWAGSHDIGDGTQIDTGAAGFVYVPINCTLTSMEVVADQSGSIVIDVLWSQFNNWPPSPSGKIGTIAWTTGGQGAIVDLSQWRVNIDKGWLAFDVTSVSYISLIGIGWIASPR